MKVAVYSIQKTLFDGDTEKIIAQTAMGEITILEDHAPLISLVRGSVKIYIQAKEGVIQSEHMIEIPVPFGFIEVKPHSKVVILVSDPDVSKPLEAVEISHKVV
ncbi:MAG: hypothetical protein Q8O83_03710 [bacterium]|nr:hypothetical protein [bacterium]